MKKLKPGDVCPYCKRRLFVKGQPIMNDTLIDDAKAVLKDDVSVIYQYETSKPESYVWEIDRDDWESAKRVVKAYLEQVEEIKKLRDAITDIDAHAIPYGGPLNPNDPEGSPAMYLVSTGSLHRALAANDGCTGVKVSANVEAATDAAGEGGER